MNISKFVAPEIIFGKNSIKQAGDACLRLGAKKVLIISDDGVVNAGWLEKVMDICKESHLPFATFIDVTIDPTDHEVIYGCQKFIENECDAIIGVGGGSVLDVAKAIAIIATNGGEIKDYEGIDKIRKPLPPMVMIMTTAGSGSEVSQFSIIVDSKRKKKMTIISKTLVPDIAIVDPYTLVTKDSDLTAATGMDVLTHAIEAYVSIAATPLTDVQAKNAITLVANYLRPSVASKTNEEAKEAMAMASLQAGLAFSNAILGAAHAISHAIGGRFPLPHGEVNAILLPYVMDFNFIAAPKRFSEISEYMGIDTRGFTQREAGNAAIEFVKELSHDIGIPKRFREVGITNDMVDILSQTALSDACMITNPRDMTIHQVKEIIEQVL
ncbi:alcohol dehydrogenase [Alkalihalobacillus alcalophilus ATCC 27647 = CGMCC 1.3604]|uniref:Alcohol dehydrogenase n=1 Tax=Alkalihalobacillus alcalophilus ATCC 27647 = CGMCC 1.3604 TaxID=1218173 RepID=A0A094WIU4_ALKAL|nr:iron-containing alcohol dehydrogenase [Alkalihalobacillus alcalophilus]KGA97714.1 alcohol dehydrogenase [Alkalihalobacillus alcalophilus ATCC 27647 = CGMCC 1.3604]MED1562594.1 iron-containing alcohol dehydrogenase [Alkalihalobacillus alcalophilus]THG91252.1 alcohol dehydrogenase [Alkalihalobacillus alcalophilus ATCC 27647 = CGMCC 1.3604]